MAKAYWLKMDGSMEKICLENIKDINDTPTSKYCGSEDNYLVSIGDGLWLYTHIDNDFKESFQKTNLTTNLALQKWFPSSQYVGHLLMLKTVDQESDELDFTDWDLEKILKKYEMIHYDDNMYFYLKIK